MTKIPTSLYCSHGGCGKSTSSSGPFMEVHLPTPFSAPTCIVKMIISERKIRTQGENRIPANPRTGVESAISVQHQSTEFQIISVSES